MCPNGRYLRGTRPRLAALLLAVQLMFALLARPTGEFPLNDDWAYALSVRWLIDENTFRLSHWIAMNLLPQTLLGWGAAGLFGYSFTTLRAMTQLIALVTSLVALRFFRICGLNPPLAFLACLVMVCLPWWQVLANSYMSDMYGLLLMLLASGALLRQLIGPRPGLLALGTAVSLLAVLQRQTALVIPLAFLVASLATRRGTSLRAICLAALPLLVTLAGEGLYLLWLAQGPGIPDAQQQLHGRLLPMARKVLLLEPGYPAWFARNLAEMAAYAGLFLAVPAAMLFAEGKGRRWLACGVAVALFAVSVWLGWLPPYRRNYLLDTAGIGPLSIDGGMLDAAHLARAKGPLWTAAAALAALGVTLGAMAAARMALDWRRLGRRRRAVRVFLATAITTYLVPFAITDYFDRYLLVILPFMLAGTLLGLEPMRRVMVGTAVRTIGHAAVLAIGLLSAAAVHDYFAWNRARWLAIRDAEQNFGANPLTLDGGFEYNGYHNFETRRLLPPPPGHNPWWVADDRFLVSLKQRKGYRVAGEFPVDRYLTAGPERVLLLQRHDPRDVQPHGPPGADGYADRPPPGDPPPR